MLIYFRRLSVLAVTALIATGALAQDPFPAGDGHDAVVRVCSACHDPRIVSQQRLTPAGWREIVDQMAARGAQATDAELDLITSYLARAFPAVAPAAKP